MAVFGNMTNYLTFKMIIFHIRDSDYVMVVVNDDVPNLRVLAVKARVACLIIHLGEIMYCPLRATAISHDNTSSDALAVLKDCFDDLMTSIFM